MSFIITYPFRNSTVLRMNSEKTVIDISPEYQRNGDIWTKTKRQLLIDSILNDYDIPKLYFYALPRPLKSEHEYSIIDGRQRLETIWSFINGDFALADDFVYFKNKTLKAGGFTYQDLAKEYPKLKILFDSYVLPIVCVETDDLDLIEDMFLRLNEAVPLNAAEKRNAFGGPMVRMITTISNHDFFKRNVKFTNKRYQYKEVAVKLIYLDEVLSDRNKILDTIKEYLDKYVKDYSHNRSSPNKVGESVVEILNEMNTIFTYKDELLRAQSAVPVYFLLFREALKQNKLDYLTRNKFVEFVNQIARNRIIAEEDLAQADYDLLEYDRMSQQGANYASSIKERFRIISEYFGI